MHTRHLFLTGYRGTGKSSVGIILAARLKLPLIDLDEQVQRGAGKTIREIFAQSGETGFRDLETRALEAVVIGPQSIIALGGGAILREGNRELIRAHGTCIWLQADPSTLATRIEADAVTQSQRPALSQLGGVDEVRQILSQRLPLYRAAANHEVDTEGKEIEAVADEILSLVGNHFAPAPRTP